MGLYFVTVWIWTTPGWFGSPFLNKTVSGELTIEREAQGKLELIVFNDTISWSGKFDVVKLLIIFIEQWQYLVEKLVFSPCTISECQTEIRFVYEIKNEGSRPVPYLGENYFHWEIHLNISILIQWFYFHS